MVSVSLQDKRLLYSGRIDDEDPERPEFIFPASSLTFWFYGSKAVLEVENHRVFWDNYVGAWVDGKEKKWKLKAEGRTEIVLLDEEKDGENTGHKVIFFKRQDCCHSFSLCSLQLSEGGYLLEGLKKPERRMEVYGDSVSAGEVSEAVDYVGRPDPVHEGEYSNSWYSYAWITARKLDAELHDIAQGGAALMDRTGWFCEPDAVGMESIFDKIEYNPQLGKSRQWDFSKYTPHVVVIAIGQNDSHPDDYMAADPHGRKAKEWKQHYGKFVKGIRAAYPNAWIILATTILQHHVHWDQAVGEVCSRIGDRKVRQFCYRRNGCGTPGHIRAAEAEQMADELSAYIKGLGDDIWAG